LRLSEFLLGASGYYFVGKSAETSAAEEVRFFLGRLPADIETSGTVQIGGRDAIWHDGCGAAIFKLSNNAVADIEQKGLKYFAAALQARDDDPYRDERLSSLVRTREGYKAWAKTPLPIKGPNAKGWLGLDCMPHGDTANDLLLELIRRESYAEGSYFTSTQSPGVTLMTIPKLRVVVYAYLD
jgi:hypothetical protein